MNPFDFSAFTRPIPKKQVTAYRHSCEVRGYDDEHGFDEQKAAPVKVGVFSQGWTIVMAVIVGLVGVIGVLIALVFFATGTNGGTRPLISGLIFCGMAYLLIRTSRSATIYATWSVRYRLSSFARANGLTYAFRSAPDTLPGITPPKPGYTGINEVKLTNVLRTPSSPQVAVGHQEVSYDSGSIMDRTGYATENWNFVGINLGASTPWIRLVHRRHPEQGALDPLLAVFSFAEGTKPEDARAFFTPQLVDAIQHAAPGHDVMADKGWLYLFRDSLIDESTKADTIAERFRIAAQLLPLVAGDGRG